MRLRTLSTIAIVGMLSIAARGYCYQAEVTDISGSKYFPAARAVILEAKKSINLVMFVIELSPYKENLKAEQLISALIGAKQRGVEVEVILDQNVDFVQRRSMSDWEAKIKSIRAYKRLRDAGIKVYYDEPVRYTHAKTIIIDKNIAILGSTNWTEASFNKSNEVNVLIKSKGLAEEILNYIKTIKIDKNIEQYLDFMGPCTPVSWEFMENPDLGPGMVKTRDERAFDIYLYLLKEFVGKPGAKLTISYETLAKYLGIYEGWVNSDYRRQINRAFKKLEQEYKLIKFETSYGKDAVVSLVGIEIATSLAYGEALGNDSTGYFEVSNDYFNFGWNRNLSLRAKFCYFINLAYADISDSKPFWSKSVATIIKQFGGVDEDIVTKGMGELRRKRLIEVKYDTLTEKPYDKRLPKMYKILRPYDPKELEAKLAGVEEKYGKAAYVKARKYAEIVFEENNPEVIADIILKIKEYGAKKVKKAFNIVAWKNIDNPKRTYVYVVGIIERMVEAKERFLKIGNVP